MRTGTAAVMLAGIVVITGIAYSFIREKDVPADVVPPVTAGADTSSKIVQVDDLARNPGEFKGEIVLRAVVVGVRKSKGVFGVIDSREFESCGTLSCAKSILPVKFSGRLPEPKAVVVITGQMVRGEKGLIIQAKRVEVVP